MGKLIVDRDLLESPLTGIEFAAYLSAGDLGTIYRDQIVLSDLTIYFNITGKIPNQKQRTELNDALNNLIDEGYLVGKVLGRYMYLIDCKKSFCYDLAHLPHGGALVLFENVQKIFSIGKGWQGMLRYYLMILSHQRVNRACAYSRQYFADILNISELTLSKYNTALTNAGLVKINHRKNMTSVYEIT